MSWKILNSKVFVIRPVLRTEESSLFKAQSNCNACLARTAVFPSSLTSVLCSVATPHKRTLLKKGLERLRKDNFNRLPTNTKSPAFYLSLSLHPSPLPTWLHKLIIFTSLSWLIILFFIPVIFTLYCQTWCKIPPWNVNYFFPSTGRVPPADCLLIQLPASCVYIITIDTDMFLATWNFFGRVNNARMLTKWEGMKILLQLHRATWVSFNMKHKGSIQVRQNVKSMESCLYCKGRNIIKSCNSSIC